MKKQKLQKKLLLNKATIADLNINAMRRFRGGVAETLDLKDKVCLSAINCPVETYPCPDTNTCLPDPTTPVTCLNTCAITCVPQCDSVFNC